MAWQFGWTSLASHWCPSPHQDTRPINTDIDMVVIHNISLPPDSFNSKEVESFFTGILDPLAHPYFASIAHLRVSAHFLIARDGTITQFVGCNRRAWHAGISEWQGRQGLNANSVGIELSGSDHQAFEAEQYRALVNLIQEIQTRYPIVHLVGHSDIAPGRKTDPGPYFDWQELSSLKIPPR